MNTAVLVVLILLFLFNIAAAVLILKKSGKNDDKKTEKLIESIDESIADTADGIKDIHAQMDADRKNNAVHNSFLREEVQNNFRSILKENSLQKEEIMRILSDSIADLQESNEIKMEKISQVVDSKLDKISGVVNEKLDKTLNERIDMSFKQVGEQLGNLYRSLGELRELSTGVQDLNKTLSNVKTRGIWGEVQLGRILEQILTSSQYEENVITKHNSTDRVEFAVKVPGEGGEVAYLPIDAKFPADIYNRIVDASENGDKAALDEAVASLKNRVLTDARNIREKYIDPPNTTTFGIMFLPTEGLYAEVLRIDGLTETCRNMNVMITGPTTITAVLNSFQAAFRSIQLSKKSVEVMKMLEAIKTQFAKMDEEIQKTQKKLHEAADATDKLQHRTELIKKKMKNIGEVEMNESEKILEIEEFK